MNPSHTCLCLHFQSIVLKVIATIYCQYHGLTSSFVPPSSSGFTVSISDIIAKASQIWRLPLSLCPGIQWKRSWLSAHPRLMHKSELESLVDKQSGLQGLRRYLQDWPTNEIYRNYIVSWFRTKMMQNIQIRSMMIVSISFIPSLIVRQFNPSPSSNHSQKQSPSNSSTGLAFFLSNSFHGRLWPTVLWRHLGLEIVLEQGHFEKAWHMRRKRIGPVSILFLFIIFEMSCSN